ncbi:hypothetical protein D3P09_02550 [Paenibacillus pinisoli]|uniref:Uncharacterized protein n=1 Tax=Paenibacillus pinisoli TaxID=1276110 RepID=A0A3A6PNF8_9BACL|nr:hypothetical protein D3P09_02550 [Paenibacillus pinisoli]
MNANTVEAIHNFKQEVINLSFSDHLDIYEAYKMSSKPNYMPDSQKVYYQLHEIKQAISNHYNTHLEKLLKTTSTIIF